MLPIDRGPTRHANNQIVRDRCGETPPFYIVAQNSTNASPDQLFFLETGLILRFLRFVRDGWTAAVPGRSDRMGRDRGGRSFRPDPAGAALEAAGAGASIRSGTSMLHPTSPAPRGACGPGSSRPRSGPRRARTCRPGEPDQQMHADPAPRARRRITCAGRSCDQGRRPRAEGDGRSAAKRAAASKPIQRPWGQKQPRSARRCRRTDACSSPARQTPVNSELAAFRSRLLSVSKSDG